MNHPQDNNSTNLSFSVPKMEARYSAITALDDCKI